MRCVNCDVCGGFSGFTPGEFSAASAYPIWRCVACNQALMSSTSLCTGIASSLSGRVENRETFDAAIKMPDLIGKRKPLNVEVI